MRVGQFIFPFDMRAFPAIRIYQRTGELSLISPDLGRLQLRMKFVLKFLHAYFVVRETFLPLHRIQVLGDRQRIDKRRQSQFVASFLVNLLPEPINAMGGMLMTGKESGLFIIQNMM